MDSGHSTFSRCNGLRHCEPDAPWPHGRGGGLSNKDATTSFGRYRRITLAICRRFSTESMTPQSGRPRFSRNRAPIQDAASCASLSRSSLVPLDPISPRVSPQHRMKCPLLSTSDKVPPAPHSTSSGCAPKRRTSTTSSPQCSFCLSPVIPSRSYLSTQRQRSQPPLWTRMAGGDDWG